VSLHNEKFKVLPRDGRSLGFYVGLPECQILVIDYKTIFLSTLCTVLGPMEILRNFCSRWSSVLKCCAPLTSPTIPLEQPIGLKVGVLHNVSENATTQLWYLLVT
jgi:hypothetical protein